MARQELDAPFIPNIAHDADMSNFEQFEEDIVDEALIEDKYERIFAWCNEF